MALNKDKLDYLNKKFAEGKNGFQVFNEAKREGIDISIATIYKKYNEYKINESKTNEVQNDKNETKSEEVKTETKNEVKTEAPKVEIKSEPIEKTSETGAIKLDASDIKVEVPTGETEEKDEIPVSKVDTGQFTAIVVEIIDGLYKKNGITPLDEDEKKKGYEYTGILADNRLKFTSKYSDIINVVGWASKTVIKRLPEFMAKSKIKKAAPVEEVKQNTNPEVTGISDWSKMSPADIIKKLGPNF